MSYTAETPPVNGNLEDLTEFLVREFRRIEDGLQEPNIVKYTVIHAAPNKPRQGLIAFADGTDWNPGGTGEGLYQYLNSGWSKL